MGNLLSKRSENIALAVLIIMVLAAAVLYFSFFRQPSLDEDTTKQILISHIKKVEEALGQTFEEYRQRAEFIYTRYRGQTLPHSMLNSREALIITGNKTIRDYYGEIYGFRFIPMDIGETRFVELRNDLFFLKKMAEDVFYMSYFCRLDQNRFMDLLTLQVADKEMKFFKDPMDSDQNVYYYDEARDLFSYSYLLNHTNEQLGIYMQFSRTDIALHHQQREKIFLYVVLLIFISGAMLFYRGRRVNVTRILWLGMLLVLFFSVSLTGEKSIVLTSGDTILFSSVYELLFPLIAIISLLYWLKNRVRNALASYVQFNLSLLLVLPAASFILRNVTFNYTHYTPKHFVLLSALFLLHLIPIFAIRTCSVKAYPKNIAGVILIQAVIILSGYFFLDISPINLLLMSIAACLLLFFPRRFLFRTLVIFLVAISIYLLMAHHVTEEKKEYIANNLKQIFLNQNNYAKLVAREIVYLLNPESREFQKYFTGDNSSRLKTLWQKTLAARENIASGIFVLSPEGEVLSQHAYQMEYIDMQLQNEFSVWAVEDTTARFYGNRISLAVASLNVFRDLDFLGRIVIQVVNSPELILRHQDKVNIFTIDNKINGKDLSYIKLDEQNQILENPSNINLQNVAGLLQYNERWITFRFIDLTFNGYIFKHDKHTYIIFFPANTLFKDFSGVIRVFLFLLFLFLLFFAREIKQVRWRAIYYSFSIRVFIILILISLMTAVVFSIFSLNVISQSSLRQARQEMYERGRTAQNIGYNHLTENDIFSHNHLLFISRILDTDVSVYKEGTWVRSSNYRKLVTNQVPAHLHSYTLERLNRKEQKFVLLDDPDGYRLYFKIHDYILEVDFAYSGWKPGSGQNYYTNFIITLFFILTIIGLTSAFVFRNKILAPIDDLNRGMADVEKGDLHTLEHFPSEIELKSLYMGFNAMVDGIREQRRNISEISRMKTIIKLGRRVAHEVKNPLTPIKLSAEQILRVLADKNPDYEDMIRQSVNYIIDETDHLKRVSYGFLDLSRLEEMQPRPFDLMRLAREEVFNYQQVYSHIRFQVDGPGAVVEVTLDKFKIKQVLKNLISNSIEAMGEKKGEINLTVEASNERVFINVVDDGLGMDENALRQIFDVDYSTKETGTGLGLFIVKRIIELHKGIIKFDSQLNRGTRVTLELPRKII